MIIKARLEKKEDIYVLEHELGEYTVVGSGKTIHEAHEDFLYGIHEVLEDEEIEVRYLFDVKGFLGMFSPPLSLSGLEKVTGVNQKMLCHYLNGHRHPSKTSVKKIAAGIHTLAETLSKIEIE